jgi:hypothetical protein
MDADLARAWRRGAGGLAFLGVCFLLPALACLRGAASRALWDSRVPGVVTDLNLTNNRGSRPTIEYAVGGKTYQFRTAALYSAETFAVDQRVTVLCSPDWPERGMLDSFRELWPLPMVLSLVSLVLEGLAWKARTGLPPMLHALCGFGLAVLGSLLGITVFSLLCVPEGLNIFAGAPFFVTMLGGMVLFVGTVPVAACGAFAFWQSNVLARCPVCHGGMRGEFVGKRLTYTCTTCGYQS